MTRLTRDGTAEPVSRDQILRHAWGQGNINFPCSADHGQDWQPHPVDPYSVICDDHTYIHTCEKKPSRNFDQFCGERTNSSMFGDGKLIDSGTFRNFQEKSGRIQTS